jgi:hypothetical protein
MTDDAGIYQRIKALVDEEHQIASTGPAEHDRRRQLEEELDQCWDLLRQRQARREAGQDPDEAHPRSVAQVEGYLQ